MNQRVTVRAIIKKDERTLFLRRSDGRPAVVGKYQLPGGRLEYGEDPKDALGRYLKETTGLTVQTTQLFDVASYIDHSNRDIQYIYIVYLVSITGNTKVQLSSRYDHYIWKKLVSMSVTELTAATQLLLNLSQRSLPLSETIYSEDDVKQTSNVKHVIIYTDGGSRGNPGPSASGYVIMNEQEQIIHEGGMYLGITTNNQAEYQAVRLALEKAFEMGVSSIDFRLDSLLVVNQMNGLYSVKNRELWPIHERIKVLIASFNKVRFGHVKREFNQLADGMVNKILDAHADTV
jgi:ribonuclease HI